MIYCTTTQYYQNTAVSVTNNAGLTFNPQAESEDALYYDIDGFVGYKSIAPLVFGDAASACDANGAPNYQGLWWNAPAGSEPGWGLYLAHQGDAIVAVSLGYDGAGNASWFSMELAKTVANSYSGPVIRSTGPSYDATFDPALVVRAEAGSATLDFTDAANGVFAATVDGVDQPTKDITRYVFGELDTACH